MAERDRPGGGDTRVVQRLARGGPRDPSVAGYASLEYGGSESVERAAIPPTTARHGTGRDAGSAIDVAPVADGNDKNRDLRVANLVENPVVADPDPVEVVLGRELPAAAGSRFIPESTHRPADRLPDLGGQPVELASRRSQKLDPVGHRSAKVVKRDRRAGVLRAGERLLCRAEVRRVLESLQHGEVLCRHERGHHPASTCEPHPLVAVGGAVD